MCGLLSEADFGELLYLNAAWLKTGANHTGNTWKRHIFLSKSTDKQRRLKIFADTYAKVYFSRAPMVPEQIAFRSRPFVLKYCIISAAPLDKSSQKKARNP